MSCKSKMATVTDRDDNFPPYRGLEFITPSYNNPWPPAAVLNFARQNLLSGLPLSHDFRKRVRNDDGDLVADQPIAQARAPFPDRANRKSKEDSRAPHKIVDQKRLMHMWNEHSAFEEDWEQARLKMEIERKRLKMRVIHGDSNVKKKRGRSKTPESAGASRVKRAGKKSRTFRTVRADRFFKSIPPIDKDEDEDTDHDSDTFTDEEYAALASGSYPDAADAQVMPSIERADQHTVPYPPAADQASGSQSSMPTPAEAVAVIPEGGRLLMEVLNIFWDRISADLDNFWDILLQVADFDRNTDMVHRKCVPSQQSEAPATGLGPQQTARVDPALSQQAVVQHSSSQRVGLPSGEANDADVYSMLALGYDAQYVPLTAASSSAGDVSGTAIPTSYNRHDPAATAEDTGVLKNVNTAWRRKPDNRGRRLRAGITTGAFVVRPGAVHGLRWLARRGGLDKPQTEAPRKAWRINARKKSADIIVF